MNCIFSGSPHSDFSWHQLTSLCQQRRSCCLAIADALTRQAGDKFLAFSRTRVSELNRYEGIWLLSGHISQPPQVAAERVCLRLHLELVGYLPRAGAWYMCAVYVGVCFHTYNIHVDWGLRGRVWMLCFPYMGLQVDSPFCRLGVQQGPNDKSSEKASTRQGCLQGGQWCRPFMGPG